MEPKKRPRFSMLGAEIITILLAILVMVVLFIVFDLPNISIAHAHKLASFQFLEITLFLLLLAVGFGWIALRRWKKSLREIEKRRRVEQDLSRIIESSNDAIFSEDLAGNVTSWNAGAERTYGFSAREVLGCPFPTLELAFEETVKWRLLVEKVRAGEHVDHFEVNRRKKTGEPITVSLNITPIKDSQGKIIGTSTIARDITADKAISEKLRQTLEISRRQQAELAALLHSYRAILENRDFEKTARSIFNSCKDLIGAVAGYVALLSKDGLLNEVLFLESGGLPCTVNPDLPMPIRGLRAQAYLTGKTVLQNRFDLSEWTAFLPEGHVKIESALFAPLMIERNVVGLLGLANKPGGFTESDAQAAAAFAELAAIALSNSMNLLNLRTSEEKIRKMNTELEQRILERTAELRWSEERYRNLIEFHPDSVNIVIEGRIVYANPASLSLFGVPAPDAIIGHPIARFLPAHVENRLEIPLQAGGETEGTSLREFQIRRGDSEVVDVEGHVLPMVHQGREAVLVILRDITQRKKAEREVLHYQDQLRASASEMVLAEQRERRRIAQGLHDQIGQLLALARIKLDGLLRNLGNTGFGSETMEIRELITETIKSTRSLTFELSPPILYASGFEAAVELLLEETQTKHGIECIFHREPPDLPLNDEIRVLFYQIVRELVMNAIKHAYASRIAVSLGMEGSQIRVSVEDNGRGFDVESTSATPGRSSGFGLFSIRERMNHIGGRMDISSVIGKGTRFDLLSPASLHAPQTERRSS